MTIPALGRRLKQGLPSESRCGSLRGMSSKTATILHSQVTNGVIPLPRGVRLAEGAEVGIVPLTPQPGDGPFLKGMLKLAKERRWPRDYALNHAHYTKGHAKK